MRFESKTNNFEINLDKEIIRTRVLEELILMYKLDKKDFIMGYNFDTTKLDPLIINKINEKTIMSDYEYKKIIKQIEKIENVKTDVIFEKKADKIYLEYYNKRYFISTSNYNRISKQLISKDFEKYTTFNGLIWCLLHRYTFFEMINGLFGSVLPSRYLKFGKPSKIFECFGSFLNHTSKYFCGLFFDLEQYFGCVGNFFDTTFLEGMYLVNPPFTVDIINMVSKRIGSIVTKSKLKKQNQLTFLIIIPTWIISDRIELNKKCKKKLRTDYSTDLVLDPILNNKKLISRYQYCTENFPYYDFIDNKIKYFASTDLILIGDPIRTDIIDVFGKPDITLHTI